MLHFKRRQSKSKKRQNAQRAYIEQLAFIRQFRKDEDGGLIVLTLLMLVSMLVVGGMAVDFMRFEAERTKLQSVSDRAVLSAANLNQERDASTVLTEFFEAEGYAGAIVGTPVAVRTENGSMVSLSSRIDVDTFFLRLIGMDTLSAPASATAMEGVGNVEISLVLDISGSMAEPMTGQIFRYDGGYDADGSPVGELIRDSDGNILSDEGTASRMFFLKQAANQFIEDLLLPEYQDLISINLIAYSQHVSIGDDLYYALRTTPDTITAPVFADGTLVEESIIGSSYGPTVNGVAEPFSWTSTDPSGAITDNYNDEGPIIATGSMDWTGDRPFFTNASRCVTFTDEEYNTLEFDTSRVYQQVETADFYSVRTPFRIGYEACPAQDFEAAIIMSQDVDELQSAISQYVPTLNTSIHRGMKWGASLLDPSMRTLINGIPTVDPVFRGSRPADYNDPRTQKYIVILTDGETVPSQRIRDGYYDSFFDRVNLFQFSAFYYAQNYPDGSVDAEVTNSGINNTMTETIGNVNTLNQRLSQICDLAGEQVTDIFTISLGVLNPTMTDCASEPGNAFFATITNDPNEAGLSEIFSRIAEQITALRLAL